MNLDSEKLNNLILSIVEQHINDERELYDFQGKAKIEQSLSGSEISGPLLRKEVNFIGEAKVVLEFFKLIDATVDIAKKWLGSNSKEKDSTAKIVLTLQDEWRETLISNGMNSELAASIASGFSHKLIEIIE